MSEGIIGSYVRHEWTDDWFSVSTIERTDSSMYAMRFTETIVWEWDSNKKERGNCVYECAGRPGDIEKHFDVCRSFRLTGEPPKTESEND